MEIEVQLKLQPLLRADRVWTGRQARMLALGAVLAVLALVSGCASTATKGPIPPEEVDDVLGSYQSELTNCYTRVVRGRVERPFGIVAVQFEIERDGRVRNASVVKSDLGLPIIDQCLLGVLTKINFRQVPRSLTVVTHEFKFTEELSQEPE